MGDWTRSSIRPVSLEKIHQSAQSKQNQKEKEDNGPLNTVSFNVDLPLPLFLSSLFVQKTLTLRDPAHTCFVVFMVLRRVDQREQSGTELSSNAKQEHFERLSANA